MVAIDIYRHHHIPRDSRCIRVLDVLPAPGPSPGLENRLIKCALRIVNIDDRPYFNALSYVWGNDPPASQYSIECEGITLPVTANCHAALQYLRRKLGHFTIWVDAVCMNQHDLTEKAQQIPLMGDIYSMAKFVYVWLGEGTSAKNRAMQYLATDRLEPFYEKNSPMAAAWFIKSSAYSWRRNPIPFPENMKPWNRRAAYTNCSDLHELFSTPWIGRVWTYQEILLASQPVLVCGDFHVPWSSMERHIQYFTMSGVSKEANVQPWMSVVLARADLQAASSSNTTTKSYHMFLENLHWRVQVLVFLEFLILGGWIMGIGIGMITSYQSDVPALNALYAVLIVLAAIFARYSRPGKTIQTFRFNGLFTPTATGICSATYKTNELINALYTRQSRDPKDMAFGMWAVLDRCGVQGLRPPDYTQDVGDVFRDFTIYLSNLTHSMEVLLFAAARSYPNQPSWVPDWASCRQQTWGQIVGKIQATDNWSVAVPNCGSNRQNSHLQIDATGSVIAISAYEVASISTCFKAQHTNQPFSKDDPRSHLENSGILHWPIANTLATLSIDTRIKQGRRPGAFKRYLLYASRLLLWKFVLRRCRNKSCAEICTMLQTLSRSYHPLRCIYRLYVELCDYLVENQRAIFTARYTAFPKELCHGECSGGVEVNDKIIRVKGLPQLLLVRPCGDSQNAVRIISPVVLKGSSLESRRSRKRENVDHVDRYVEYRMY